MKEIRQICDSRERKRSERRIICTERKFERNGRKERKYWCRKEEGIDGKEIGRAAKIKCDSLDPFHTLPKLQSHRTKLRFHKRGVCHGILICVLDSHSFRVRVPQRLPGTFYCSARLFIHIAALHPGGNVTP